MKPNTVAIIWGLLCLASTCVAADIRPGQVWLDTDGNPIESHLGGILYENGTYYWYGMNFRGKTMTPLTLPGQTFSWMANQGVSIYSSNDLCRWKLERITLQQSSSIPANDLLLRPKAIKNDKTGKYVLMAQMCAPDWSHNDILVATSDAAVGAFEVDHVFTPPGGAFDITLYKDDDGRAYLITAHEWVKIHELSDDYLSIKKTAQVDGVLGEAPAVFKHDGVYYMLTSDLTGWAPNPNKYSVAESIWGPWQPKGTFCTGAGADNTFAAQTTHVLPLANRTGCFIFMADRTTAKTATLIDDMSKMTHVWLPLNLDPVAQTIQVSWRDQWSPVAF